STPYNWDGSSNLVIEICYSNTSYSSADYVDYSVTSNISCVYNYNYATPGCTLPPAYYYYERPNIIFGVCTPPASTFSYIWTPTSGLSNYTSSNPTTTITSNTLYKVVVNGGNCQVTDSVLAIPNQSPVVTISPATCVKDSFQLYATGGTSYSWSPATGLSNVSIANPKALPAANTTYKVTVSNNLRCQTLDSVTLYRYNLTPAVDGNKVICKGDSVKVTASGAATYSWTPLTGVSNPNLANPKVSPPSTTEYYITYTSADGKCTTKDSVLVTVNNKPLMAVSKSSLQICTGHSAKLSASG